MTVPAGISKLATSQLFFGVLAFDVVAIVGAFATGIPVSIDGLAYASIAAVAGKEAVRRAVKGPAEE